MIKVGVVKCKPFTISLGGLSACICKERDLLIVIELFLFCFILLFFFYRRSVRIVEPFEVVLKINFIDACRCRYAHIQIPVNFKVSLGFSFLGFIFASNLITTLALYLILLNSCLQLVCILVCSTMFAVHISKSFWEELKQYLAKF